MIKEAIKSIKEIFIPKSGFIQCAIDDDVVDCQDLSEWEEDAQKYYTGVPAPDYLSEDPWFPAPVLSDKQMTIKEAHEQAIADNQILADESEGVVESSDIHQKMYEIATKGSATTLQLDPPGGSENFHEGPGGWNSGTGLRQFH